jgi:hypothetical protein
VWEEEERSSVTDWKQSQAAIVTAKSAIPEFPSIVLPSSIFNGYIIADHHPTQAKKDRLEETSPVIPLFLSVKNETSF